MRLSTLLAATALGTMLSTAALAYDRATGEDETSDVIVLNKLFPKKGRFELDTKFGIVLNSSYVQSYLANVSASYFWSENWGFDLEGNYVISQDKPERQCIENFYNDPNNDVGSQCGDPSNLANDTQKDANMGPAYVPIRQLQYIFTGNFNWNPIYGKQIVLLSATNYFDFYLNFGGGIAMSQYYPQQTNFPGGQAQRGTFCTAAQQALPATDPHYCQLSQQPGGVNPGTAGTNTQLFGNAGRPLPKSETNPLIHLAVGQRFHFFRRFLLTASLENYTLLGTEAGYDNFLVLTGGIGVRF